MIRSCSHFGKPVVLSDPTIAMTGQSSSVSNVWSSASLDEGVNHVLAQSYSQEEEARLLKELQDCQTITCILIAVVYIKHF